MSITVKYFFVVTQLSFGVSSDLAVPTVYYLAFLHFLIGSLCSFIEPDTNGLIRSRSEQRNELSLCPSTMDDADIALKKMFCVVSG